MSLALMTRQGSLSIREVIIQLIHLHDNVIGDSSLGRKDIKLAGHSSACNKGGYRT